MDFTHFCDHVMVLAAGFGKRLLPLTQKIPKPLLDIGQSKTLLDYHLETIKKLGFHNAVINVHYLSDQIKAHIIQKQFGVTIHEPILLDTGGGVCNAYTKGYFSKPFLCVNSDAYTPNISDYENTLKKMIRFFDKSCMDVLLLLSPLSHNKGYQGKGDFFCDEKQPSFRGNYQSAPFVYNGIQILSPHLFEYEEGIFSMRRIWEKAQKRGTLYAFIEKKCTWIDTGTMEGFKAISQS